MLESKARNFLIDPLRDVEARVVDVVPLVDGSEGFGVDVKENPPSRGVGDSREVSFDNTRQYWVREMVLALGHQHVEDVEGILRR